MIDWTHGRATDKDVDFSQGFEKLQELVDKWEGPEQTPARYNLKLFADKETYEAVDELAKLQNKSAHQLAIEVIRNFVAAQQNGKSERVIWEIAAASLSTGQIVGVSFGLVTVR